MSGKITFTMIKPDAVADGHIGAILGKISEAGYKVTALKLTQLTNADAKKFYEVHAERPFYGELVDFMSSGPIVAAVLEKDNAVEDFRTLIGATNPAEAAEGNEPANILASEVAPYSQRWHTSCSLTHQRRVDEKDHFAFVRPKSMQVRDFALFRALTRE